MANDETKTTPVRRAWAELLLIDLLEGMKPEERAEAIELTKGECWQTLKKYYGVTVH